MSDLLIVRAVRPYSTEAEWVRAEGWTIGRKSVYLIDIPPQPEGTRVRCELALQGGRQLLVAEGVVIKYANEHADRPPGLVIRYRRLSTSSSQFIDRVLNARDRDAAELSCPSVTDCASQVSETRQHPEAIDHSSPRSASIRDLALERLRGRTNGGFATSAESPSAIERLRLRFAKQHCK